MSSLSQWVIEPLPLILVFFLSAYSLSYGFSLPSFLASIPGALRGSTYALTWLCSIWLWQCWLRPDWRPWGIAPISIVCLALSVIGHLSIVFYTPELGGWGGTLAMTAVGSTFQFLQAVLAIWLFALRSRSYEPFVRDAAVNSCWNHRSLQALEHGATCGQPPNHSRDPLRLDSLYQAHQRILKEHAGKFPSHFTSVSRWLVF